MSEIIFLGTGTSSGVPVIGCQCKVCKSNNPKNNRTRTSLLISHEGKNILIDTSVDLRQQALRENIEHLEAILYTHTHADHIFGLDDIRRFNYFSGGAIPTYLNETSAEELKRIFYYIFNSPKIHGGIPDIKLNIVDGPFWCCGLEFIPIPIWHGPNKILGFRFKNVAYLTDCSDIPQESMGLLQGLDLLILDALREKPHPTHFSLKQACAMAEEIEATQTYFVHMCHDLEHEACNINLPSTIKLAYDGQRVEFE